MTIQFIQALRSGSEPDKTIQDYLEETTQTIQQRAESTKAALSARQSSIEAHVHAMDLSAVDVSQAGKKALEMSQTQLQNLRDQKNSLENSLKEKQRGLQIRQQSLTTLNCDLPKLAQLLRNAPNRSDQQILDLVNHVSKLVNRQ